MPREGPDGHNNEFSWKLQAVLTANYHSTTLLKILGLIRGPGVSPSAITHPNLIIGCATLYDPNLQFEGVEMLD